MPEKELYKRKFDETGNDPMEWVFTADDLLAADRFLCQHSYHLSPNWGSIDDHFPTFDEWRITGVIVMLRAMTVECLLKALWLKGGGQLARDGQYRRIPGTHDHNLASLADKVSEKFTLGISEAEYDLLERLSRNIAGGRYPIQKNWDINRQSLAGGDRRRIPGFMPPDYDDDLFASLVSKLRTPFEDELRVFYKGIYG